MSYNYNFMKLAEKNNQIMKTSVQYFIVTEMVLNANIAYTTYFEQLEWEERTIRNLMYVSSLIIMLTLSISQMYLRGTRIIQGLLVFRSVQIFTIFFITITHEVVLYPPVTIIFFAIQFIYMFTTIFTKRMDFPGNIIQSFSKTPKEKERKTNHFTSIANEIIRKNCSLKEEEEEEVEGFDDLFEYKTASEDELYSASISFD